MNKTFAKKLYFLTEYAILLLYSIFLTEAFLRASAFDFVWSDRLHNILRAFLLAVIIVRYVSRWIACGMKDIPQVLILCVIAVLLASSRFFNDVGSFIDVELLVLAAKDIDMSRILRLFLIVTAILLALAMIAALSMHVENYISYHGTAKRYAFGTLSALDFAAYFFYMELAWFALRREKIRYFEFAIIAAAIAALLILCNARTSAMAMAAALVIAFIFKLRSTALLRKGSSKPLIPSWLLYAAALLISLCAIFIIAATYKYSDGSRISLLLDRILNNRLALGRQGMDEYGFSLFGRMVETIGVPGTADYFFIDSSFVYILLRYGIVTFIGAIALFQIPALYAAGKKDAWTVMVLTFVALHSIMEHHLLAVNFDPFIFVVSAGGGALACRKSDYHPAAQKDINIVRNFGGENELALTYDNLSTAWKIAGSLIIGAFAASTVFFMFTCGRSPRYGIYETTVPGVITPGSLPAESAVQQEVLLPMDICGIEIMIDTDGSPSGDYIWKMWEDEFGHEAEIIVPGESILDEEYTRIITDSKELQAWLKYRFSIEPADGAGDELQIMLGQPTNDFCRPVYVNGQKKADSVMNFNLVYRYNDWRMMVWIFELTTLASIAYLVFSRKNYIPFES